MTMPGVSCTAVAMQNSSEWPCSRCPLPQHIEFWTPLQIPIWGPLLAAPCYTLTKRIGCWLTQVNTHQELVKGSKGMQVGP